MKLLYFGQEVWEEEYITQRLPGMSVEFRLGSLSQATMAGSDADALSVFVNSTVGATQLDLFPRLKHIATRSTGFDHIDLTEAARRGMSVSSVPSYGVNTVAEFAFALLLALVRNVREANQRVTEGSLEQSRLTGIDLYGKTIGIIGCGRIGACAVQIAKGFGMEVVVYDAFENTELATKLGFTYIPLDELLSRSDVISIHAPYTADTHHLINSTNISKIKRGAYLINTARGALVESGALLAALNDGTLGGAGLDVLEHEHDLQDPTNRALISHRAVLVTPHVGFDTVEAIKRILDTTIENILAFEQGTPKNLVMLAN